MASLSLNLKEDVLLNLSMLAKETGRSRSYYANEALSEYLKEKLEDIEDYQIAERAWKEFVASGKKTIPAEEVYKELGI